MLVPFGKQHQPGNSFRVRHLHDTEGTCQPEATRRHVNRKPLRKPLVLLAAGALAAMGSAYGQLHLITGSATPKHNVGYPTQLPTLDGNGAALLAEEMVPESGMEWADVSGDRRLAVFRQKFPDRHVIVLDRNTGRVVKRCEVPLAPAGRNRDPFMQWLMDVPLPGRGRLYVERFGGADPAQNYGTLRGMRLSPAIPCQQSFLGVEKSDVRYIGTLGQTGVFRDRLFQCSGCRTGEGWPSGGKMARCRTNRSGFAAPARSGN